MNLTPIPKKRSPLRKWLIGIVVALSLVIVLPIAAFSIYWAATDWRDRGVVETAAKEIKLPAQYHLVGSHYESAHCLDVCPHVTLTYQMVGGASYSQAEVDQALEQAGYRLDEVGDYYTKAYKNQTVHVRHYPGSGETETLEVTTP